MSRGWLGANDFVGGMESYLQWLDWEMVAMHRLKVGSVVKVLAVAAVLCSLACAAQESAYGGMDSASPSQRVSLAMQSLMRHYQSRSGLWDTEGWWNAANSVTVLGAVDAAGPSTDVEATLQNTFTAAQGKFSQFRNEYYDDEGWWALAWIQAYDATHRAEYLEMAESIFSDMSGGWDDTCGGGIWWKKDKHYKNAIANELFLSVAAHLATRVAPKQRKAYLGWAAREWKWFDASGMINDEHLVNDGLTPDCKNNGRTAWTYNQGVLIGGLTELSHTRKHAKVLSEAQLLAHASLAHLTDEGFVLHDRTEPKCSPDTVQFKGIFVRNLFALQKVSPDEEYARFFKSNADSIWQNARTQDDEFACRWTGPAEADGAAATTSAADALVAAAGGK